MVRATFAGFDTALSALRMNQKKLDLVGHNLANMNTEGYTRQELKTSSINYENPTSFYMNSNDTNVGFGVGMDGVRQLRDQFLDKQYRTQNGRASYTEGLGESLKSLSLFLDETKVDGIRASFDNIQKSLTNMQDPSKVQDPVYEGELMSRVQAMTTLMNSAAESIVQAQKNEFHKIDGTGTSENGAIQKINSLIEGIGDLNTRIKKNQLLGSPVLELQDERNKKLDELSKYVPIETESFSEEYTVGTETRYRIYNYDSAGNITGRSDWPEDLRVNLVYRDSSAGNGAEVKKITLVNGAIDGNLQDSTGRHRNVGKVELATPTPATVPPQPAYSQDNPLNTQLKFTGYSKRTATPGTFNNDAFTTNTKNVRFASGTVQASLDMLSTSDVRALVHGGGVINLADLKASNEMTAYSYDYYMGKLDLLAETFTKNMNEINKKGNTDYTKTPPVTNPNHILMINKDKAGGNDPSEVTAANIGISRGWVNGTTHIGTRGFHNNPSTTNQGDTTDTVLEMLEQMTSPMMKMNNTKTSYADYMNNLSTTLATDSYSNNNSYTINKAVLDGINTSRDQISGVSLDEEAANMMTYQSSYNAAARLMTTLNNTLETLLSIGR